MLEGRKEFNIVTFLRRALSSVPCNGPNRIRVAVVDRCKHEGALFTCISFGSSGNNVMRWEEVDE